MKRYILFSLIISTALISCIKQDGEAGTPTVTTLEASEITRTTAMLSGETEGGEGNMLTRGVCFSTSELVSFDDRCVAVTAGSGKFSVTTHGLDPVTTYYIRAFAMLSDGGIVYGELSSFTTKDEVYAEIGDVDVIERTMNSVKVSSSVVNPHGTVIEYGFCWSLTGVPDINGKHCSLDGEFEYTIGALEPNTRVYVRAYAVNEEGVSYSATLDVKTRNYEYPGKTVTVTPPDVFFIGWLGDPSDKENDALYGGAQDGSFREYMKLNTTYATASKVSGLAPYRIGEHEVTYSEYVDFLNLYGSETTKDGDFKGKRLFWTESSRFTYDSATGKWSVPKDLENHPATGITWFGAYEFCSFYGGFLPNEPQWECAARAAIYTDSISEDPDGQMYMYSGSNDLNEVAVTSSAETAPVCSKKPNALGLYDMSGNAQEWTMTNWFRPYATVWSDSKPNGKNMVARGGRCQRGVPYVFHNGMREAFSGENFAAGKSLYLGFRFCDSNVDEQ